jgi:hypothetical protein
MFAKAMDSLSQVVVMVISLTCFGTVATDENTPKVGSPEWISMNTQICSTYPKCENTPDEQVQGAVH